MYFPVELWREIKSYIFHNIKIHGIHLKNDTEIKKFNKVVKSVPLKYKPNIGPIIVYGLPRDCFRFVKFVYYVPAPRSLEINSNKYKLIIEYMDINCLKHQDVHYCDCHDDNMIIPKCLKDEVRIEYNKNVIKKVWFI